MHLGFLFTNKCNIWCDHCSTNCGPDQHDRLSVEQITRLMRDAAELEDGYQPCFSISGGEPFLFWDDLLEMVAAGVALGSKVTCVTNGYWAGSHRKALAKTRALKSAGLNLLAISTSQYHQRFIPLEKVRTAAQATIDAGLGLLIKYPYTRSSLQPEDIARLLGPEIMEFAIMEHFSVMPTVRSGFELPAGSMVTETELPKGACPAAIVTIREDGEAYTCCIPGGFIEPLKLGNIAHDSLAVIKDRFDGGDLQQLLFAEGPKYIAQKAKEVGLGDLVAGSYTGVCHLCTHVLSNPQLREFAQGVAENYQLERLKQVLTLDEETDRPTGQAQSVSSAVESTCGSSP